MRCCEVWATVTHVFPQTLKRCGCEERAARFWGEYLSTICVVHHEITRLTARGRLGGGAWVREVSPAQLD